VIVSAGTLVVVALVFGGLIALHEFGHFVVAKRSGVQVDEFSLGFGPRLARLRRGETDYSLRLVPLGGFVRMAGMYPNEADGSAEAQRSREANASGRGWAAHGVGQRLAVIAAGPAMNFLVGALLVAFVFGALGVPTRPTLVVSRVEAGYPAARAGIRPGDRVLSVDGRLVRDWTQLHQAISPRAGRPVTVVVERGGRDLTLRMTPVPAPDGSGGLIGISPVMLVRRAGPLSALWKGVVWTWEIVAGWFVALAGLLRGGGHAQLLGPVGIGQQIGVAAQNGLPNLLLFVAALSANLGLINLLPIPALDGSRLVFLAVEGVRGRPVDPEKEGFVHLVGFALIVVLTVLVTYHDLIRLNLG
jgi:regulator of sigma E protease